jgi:hypothetical protein
MRLVVYGMVALLCGAVLAVRAQRSPAPAGDAMYHGQTRERLLAAVTVSGGRVESAYLRWRMTCDHGRASYVSTIRFGVPFGDELAYRGRDFSFRGSDEQAVRRGTRTRYEVQIAGTVSDDGRTVTGHGRTTETHVRDGRALATCRSEDVPWTVHRGAVVNQ